MSPVPERSMEMEESPGASSLMTNSTIRAGADAAGLLGAAGSPSQIPVARLKRLSGIGAASSPGSPSLRRSNTIDSFSRNNNSPQQQNRSSPLSPRYGIAAGNLNRSTNSRNIASLASISSSSATGSPAPVRYAGVQRHASSSTATPLRPLATPRKGSDGASNNSIYAAKRQEISSKTANLVARLQGISAAHKTVVRKTSGGFHRVANAISHHTHNGHGMLARSVSGQSDQADHHNQQEQHGKEPGQQTGHDMPSAVLGDISTVSTNSPGSWVVVKERSTPAPGGNFGGLVPLDQENEDVRVSSNKSDGSSSSLLVSANRSLKSLPARPGIPSPLNQSVSSKTPIQERNVAATTRRNLRVYQPASHITVASSRTSESNSSLASLGGDSGMRVFSRPDSRLSGRDAESEEWVGTTVKSSGGGSDDALPMIAPPPPSSRHHAVNGARPTGNRRIIEPPPLSVSRSNNMIDQAALPPRSSSVQGHHRAAPAARPISTRRKTPPPGVAVVGVTSGTGGGSGIPRRSLSGRRPMSMSMVPQDAPPPLPVGALAHVEAGRRAAAIGIGLPSASRRMGGR